MERYTKEEISENRRLVGQMAQTEGWGLVKEMVNTFVLDTEREIMIAPADDPNRMNALANKLKFGTGALLWLFSEVDKIKEGLDKR